MADIDVFKDWAEAIRPDIEAFKALLESPRADANSRRIAGAALLYLVSRMDLIPDWSPGIGVLDDVMVLRVCAQLAQGFDRGELASAADIGLERMANEAERVEAFLGGAIYERLKAYCARLSDQAVRGRAPAQLADEAGLRAALYAEIEDEIKKSTPVVIGDPADAEVRLRAYLTHKLR